MFSRVTVWRTGTPRHEARGVGRELCPGVLRQGVMVSQISHDKVDRLVKPTSASCVNLIPSATEPCVDEW